MENSRQFCLKWNDHQSTLIHNFDMLLESGMLADCTLAAEGKYLKAHKLVLSACSPYFEELLNVHYDKHPVFILKDVKFNELIAMMDYMYKGEVNISEDQLSALLNAAESLQIKGLSVKDTGTKQTLIGTQIKTKSKNTLRLSNLTVEKSQVSANSTIETPVCALSNDSDKILESTRGSSQSPLRKCKRSRRISLSDTLSMEGNSHPINTNEKLAQPDNEMTYLPTENLEHSEKLVEPKFEYVEIMDESTSAQSDAQRTFSNIEQNSDINDPKTHDPTPHSSFTSWDPPQEEQIKSGEFVLDESLKSQHSSQESLYYNMPLESSYEQVLPNLSSFHVSNKDNSATIQILKQRRKENDSNMYQCKKCPKSFLYDRSLWRHMKFECSKEPRFKCPYCPFLAKQSTNVSVHVRGRHKGMKICYIDLFRGKTNL